MRKHKYLDDIGVTNRPDTWNKNDARQKQWKKEREKYGFDERETWNIEFTWHLWLYERLMAYIEWSDADLDYYEFEFKGENYTQGKLIDMMLERLQFSFSTEYDDVDEDQKAYVNEIGEIWALVVSSMWW